MEKLKKQPKFQLSQSSGVHTATWPNQWADKCATRASSLPLLLHARKARSLATSSVQGRVPFTAPACKLRASPANPSAPECAQMGPRAALSASHQLPRVRLSPWPVNSSKHCPTNSRHVFGQLLKPRESARDMWPFRTKITSAWNWFQAPNFNLIAKKSPKIN